VQDQVRERQPFCKGYNGCVNWFILSTTIDQGLPKWQLRKPRPLISPVLFEVLLDSFYGVIGQILYFAQYVL
jgi:hypothetical protein